MDRHRFPRESRRISPILLGRAPERDITGTVIERVGSVAPAQLSVKARPVKPTLPALRSGEGTRPPARLRSGLRHRSVVARERLALAQGVAPRLGGRRRRPFALPRA
jgi:hypothetical protein